MSEKLPFYMAYQNQLPIDTAWERENSRDVSYMKKYVSGRSEKDSAICRGRMRPAGI